MKLLNIATIIALSTVVDHSSSQVLATTTLKTSEYELEQEEDEDDASLGILATATKTSEYETIPKQEDDEVVVPLLPTLLRGAKKAVNQFLSVDGDGDNEELVECMNFGGNCNTHSDCCSNYCYINESLHIHLCEECPGWIECPPATN